MYTDEQSMQENTFREGLHKIDKIKYQKDGSRFI